MIAVAQITSGPWGARYTLFNERNSKLKVFFSRRFSIGKRKCKWNMSELSITEDECQRQFVEAVKTKEGQEIINNLKNEKTNYFINRYLSIEKAQMEQNINNDNTLRNKDERKNRLNIIQQLIDQPLEGYNLLSQRLTSVSKEEIVEAFIKNNLIKI